MSRTRMSHKVNPPRMKRHADPENCHETSLQQEETRACSVGRATQSAVSSLAWPSKPSIFGHCSLRSVRRLAGCCSVPPYPDSLPHVGTTAYVLLIIIVIIPYSAMVTNTSALMSWPPPPCAFPYTRSSMCLLGAREDEDLLTRLKPGLEAELGRGPCFNFHPAPRSVPDLARTSGFNLEAAPRSLPWQVVLG